MGFDQNYICPFCNHTSTELTPIGLNFPVLFEKEVIGGGYRLGGCQNCSSTDRERLIYIFLREKLKIFQSDKNKKILHIAPEINLTEKLLTFGFSEYICGDLFAYGYKYQDHVRNINILDIPFDKDTFDLIICNHVLEHISSDQLAMKEILRVLKGSGIAILQVPISKSSEKTFEDFSITDPRQRELAFGQFDHVRIYGQDYPEKLKQSGFVVTRVNISHEFAQYGLNQDEDIFVCTKLECS